MSQERVSNDEFLTRLATLFSSTHSAAHGSVYLTQKTLASSSSPSSPEQSSSEQSPAPSPTQILVRATNGLSKPHRATKTKTKTTSGGAARIKLATVVDLADLEAFSVRYAEVCKKGMEGLRKRDKKKAKEKAKAKKKGKSGATTGGTGL